MYNRRLLYLLYWKQDVLLLSEKECKINMFRSMNIKHHTILLLDCHPSIGGRWSLIICPSLSIDMWVLTIIFVGLSSMFYWFWHIFDLTHMHINKMTFGLVHAQHVNECLMSNHNILVLLFCISILSLNFIINKNNDVMTIFSIDQSDIKVVSCYMRIHIYIDNRGCTHVWRTKKGQSLTIKKKKKRFRSFNHN